MVKHTKGLNQKHKKLADFIKFYNKKRTLINN